MISSPAPAINAADLGGGALNVPATKSLTRYYWWNEGLHGYNRIDNGASSIGGKPGPAPRPFTPVVAHDHMRQPPRTYPPSTPPPRRGR